MKTIFITGANRGIGLEMAKQYLSDGWKVIATCRNLLSATDLKALATKNDKQLELIQLDVKNAQEISKLESQLKNTTIDILLNNAGVIGDRNEAIGNIEKDKWLEVFSINTIAPLLVSQALISNIINSELKIIANMSSMMGSISLNTDGGYYTYRSSKAALNAITRTLSIDLKDHGVMVVALHPGWVKTDMGGEGALITREESVSKLRNVLSGITMKESGMLINFEGKILPW